MTPYVRDLASILRAIVRWVLLIAPMSATVGTACALFLWLLNHATKAQFDNHWLLFLLPLAGVAVSLGYHLAGRDSERGNNLIIDEIHEPAAGVPVRMAPLILFSTVVTHLFGGSAGREGTAVQIGGGLASGWDRVFKLSPSDRRVFLMAGVAAGFGAVFGTPLAGAIFAMEVLAIGRLEYAALVPVLISALLADWTTSAWGIEHTHYVVTTPGRSPGDPPFELGLMAKAIVAGVAFGLASIAFAELVHGCQRIFRSALRWQIARPFAGGLLVIGLTYAVGNRDYLGLGVTSPDAYATTIVSSFHEGGASSFAWFWKMAFTVVTLGSGFKGGEVTPLFYIGASLGNVLSRLLDAPADLFAALGFVAVFAGAANTPLACTMMGIELFGADHAVYLATACFVSYLVSGHSGIYLSQRLFGPKMGRRHRPEHLTLRHVYEGERLVSKAIARVRRR